MHTVSTGCKQNEGSVVSNRYTVCKKRTVSVCLVSVVSNRYTVSRGNSKYNV